MLAPVRSLRPARRVERRRQEEGDVLAVRAGAHTDRQATLHLVSWCRVSAVQHVPSPGESDPGGLRGTSGRLDLVQDRSWVGLLIRGFVWEGRQRYDQLVYWGLERARGLGSQGS